MTRLLIGHGLGRWQRGLFCITTMIAAGDALEHIGFTGLTTTVVVGVSVAILFSIRVKAR
jgi:hypothetical protein